MGDSKKSLVSIDFGPFAEVANNLIDKLSLGIGWVFTHETPKKLALQGYAKEIQSSDLSPLEKAALISNSKQTIKAYCNQKDIVQIALDNLSEKARPQEVDDEFLSRFMDSAQHVSAEDIKIIWGKILANECNTPGSTPKSLIRILSDISSETAQNFAKIANYTVCFLDSEQICWQPLIWRIALNNRTNPFDYYGITYESLLELQTIGLIQFANTIFTRSSSDSIITVRYFQHTFKIRYNSNGEILVGNVLFTHAGSVLYQALSTEEPEGFSDKIKAYWIGYLVDSSTDAQPQ